jgi:hypothetical protein
MNTFVKFLDQFNVLSPNHSKIYDEYTLSGDKHHFSIETKIESYLLDLFTNKPCSVIMTGNAGDGKTRLCRAIYEKLAGKSLSKWPDSGIIELSYVKGKIRILKDLSELTDPVIMFELLQLQNSIIQDRESNVFYLIAANEGKLTKSLSDSPELTQLAQMVKSRFLDHTNNDGKLLLINLQDVTSSIYVDRIIREWNRDENWESCLVCSQRNKCVINLNHRRMKEPTIRERLVEQYRLLDCLGIHVTMREILIHMSYVLTGGLTCDQVIHAGYKDIEAHANLVYYENFYGVQMPLDSISDQGAIRYFKQLDPGKLSISMIDDYLLNGDISGDEQTVSRHKVLFDDEIDLLFGYYRKLIEQYRVQGLVEKSKTTEKETSQFDLSDLMPKFRRKYFFETSEDDINAREKLIPYIFFYRYLKCLSDAQTRSAVKKELIRGLNINFIKKLIRRDENNLFVANENLLIHNSYSPGQISVVVDNARDDIDYTPSKLMLRVGSERKIDLGLPLFEYLLRLAGGGMFVVLRQEVEILLETFKNDLINHSDLDEFVINVFAIDPKQGVYKPYEIDI